MSNVSWTNPCVQRNPVVRNPRRAEGNQALALNGGRPSQEGTAASVKTAQLDTAELERQVQHLYRRVAEAPDEGFHFPLGRGLAEQLGYPPDLLDSIPADALASFAGVGYALDVARLTTGDRVLDLGSGSGTDAFAAAMLVAPSGRVTGVDMTDEQLAKASRLRDGFGQLQFQPGRLESLPFPDRSFDVVISNGVINLCPDKALVFREAARVLRHDGRLAIADIVTARELPQSVTCNADLWSACIGGAMPELDYRAAIEAAGFRLHRFRDVPQYQFLTDQARNASATYGVRAVTVAATRT
jgi:SAM-dependent methyltransferase